MRIDHECPNLQMHAAVNASEQQAVEKAMLEDKLKATDWEATNEAIEEQVWSSTALVQYLEIENLLLLQVARESYLQWLAEQEKQKKNSKNPPAATVTSGQVSPRGGSSSPRGGSSPRNAAQVTNAFKTLNTPILTNLKGQTMRHMFIHNLEKSLSAIIAALLA